jgi:hypothetical protein
MSILGWALIKLGTPPFDTHARPRPFEIKTEQWPEVPGGALLVVFSFLGHRVDVEPLDTMWPYWNLINVTPERRPDGSTPKGPKIEH